MNFNTQTKTGNTPFKNLDAISALKEISDGAAAICSGGASITLFEDAGFKGASTTRNENDSDLRLGPFQGWNDRTSSIVVNSGTWTVSEDQNFTGRSQKLSSTGGPKKDGRYNINDLKTGNDTISSISIG